MSISYESIGQVCITCYCSSAGVNHPCKVSSNHTVVSCADGDEIEGVVVAKHSNLATVAVKGFVTLPYTGSAPNVGHCPLASAGSGKVKVSDGAREYLVVNVDTPKKYVTFCL